MTYTYHGKLTTQAETEAHTARILAEAEQIRAEARATLRLAQARTARTRAKETARILTNNIDAEPARQLALITYPTTPEQGLRRQQAAAAEAATWHKSAA